MRLKSEDEILKDDVRKKIIEEIEGTENKRRRSRAYKWHEIWKNKSKRFVRDLLARFLDMDTVQEMEYSLSNISIARKIVDKLAKVYANGVIRKFDDPVNTEALACLEDKLEINMQMKTANKLLKLLRNAVLYIKPVMFLDKEGNQKWRPAWVPMSSHLYDVIEMENDRTKPMVFILSNFERSEFDAFVGGDRVGELAAQHKISSNTSAFPGDGIDQKIADKKEDEGETNKGRVYIWWTDKYHFTTKGSEIIDPETGLPPLFKDGQNINDFILNPIGQKPFVDLHIDQEGHYWAEGGDDLIDGDLLVNSMLSNYHHIGVTQGYGQLVLMGTNLPNTIKLGPNKTINLSTTGEEGGNASKTEAKFITADPPLDALSRQVEMYVALLLTTNNLSTSGVQSKLSGGIMAPSGIAIALDKSESLEDVKDQRDIFLKGEKRAFKITAEWLQFFDEENILADGFAECKIPLDQSPSIEFQDAQTIMSEKEKLENLKLRKDLGINRAVELIMKDRGVSEEEAQKILLELTKERIEKMAEMMGREGERQEDIGEPEGDDE